MKVTLHGGKGNAKHNDHNPTKRDNGHIDYSRKPYNFKWTCMDTKDCKYSIEDGENRFYDEFFAETLEKTNEKYIKKGQYGRVRNMREWQKAPQHRPREVILQIGDKDNHPSEDVVFQASREFLRWKKERYKDNLKIISSTMHVDESTPHLHIDEVWFYRDEDGLPQTGIKKALEQAGVELPDPTQPESKKNYRMATVDAECCEKWQEICKSYGLEIETEPDREREVGHMGVDAWKEYQQAKEVMREQAIAQAEEYAQIKDEFHLECQVRNEELDSERADVWLDSEQVRRDAIDLAGDRIDFEKYQQEQTQQMNEREVSLLEREKKMCEPNEIVLVTRFLHGLKVQGRSAYDLYQAKKPELIKSGAEREATIQRKIDAVKKQMNRPMVRSDYDFDI